MQHRGGDRCCSCPFLPLHTPHRNGRISLYAQAASGATGGCTGCNPLNYLNLYQGPDMTGTLLRTNQRVITYDEPYVIILFFEHRTPTCLPHSKHGNEPPITQLVTGQIVACLTFLLLLLYCSVVLPRPAVAMRATSSRCVSYRASSSRRRLTSGTTLSKRAPAQQAAHLSALRGAKCGRARLCLWPEQMCGSCVPLSWDAFTRVCARCTCVEMCFCLSSISVITRCSCQQQHGSTVHTLTVE